MSSAYDVDDNLRSSAVRSRDLRDEREREKIRSSSLWVQPLSRFKRAEKSPHSKFDPVRPPARPSVRKCNAETY